MITKIPKISLAQAKQLARIWGETGSISVSEDWNDPTTVALKKRGLIEPTGETGRHPSGAAFAYHRINLLGKGALFNFLRCEFIKERDNLT